ncbi:hypothetical protein BBF96_01715 [Anoxybacter fermentans]|uniref:DUF2089 domain-containing protein n=1 Tax=Anoxybacter fermentans TaxID=1323375 RepID=A0A3S9SVC0_9FIRM|nr:DUF2089 domain-containing protein [Anoxybacter fermentans]AZR72224.1 hypothetical protein BBF96_01715 [Anoxybacter fermentans]
MAHEIIGKCPVCNQELEVVKLKCRFCGTSIEGNFEVCKFCRLESEQKHFVEVFIRCRGNIKEVERELNISYPTVRSKLDQVIKALGYDVGSAPDDDKGAKRKEILDMLNSGEITSKEAIKLLKEL